MNVNVLAFADITGTELGGVDLDECRTKIPITFSGPGVTALSYLLILPALQQGTKS